MDRNILFCQCPSFLFFSLLVLSDIPTRFAGLKAELQLANKENAGQTQRYQPTLDIYGINLIMFFILKLSFLMKSPQGNSAWQPVK